MVIAILAILALIAIPRLAGFTDSAKKSALEADAKTITTSISALAADLTPTDFAALDLEGDKDNVSTELTDLSGPFSGTISAYAYDAGDIDFTYATAEFTVDVVDSVVGQATEVTS